MSFQEKYNKEEKGHTKNGNEEAMAKVMYYRDNNNISFNFDDLSNYIQFQSINDIFISEGGTNFSGGQRQRLAMLRLFMKEYPLLILDEPTNHLDRETANAVIENIFAIPSTKIIITHDENILERVDRVYELTDKKLEQREISSKSRLQTLGKG
nr:ATP-binding cassette domain-containing protein [Bacillus sp. LK2]